MTTTRRRFLAQAASLAGSLLAACARPASARVPVYGHLWVYASDFPPDWDCTPVLETVFRDFQAAGIEGVEVMDAQLRNPDMPPRAAELAERYQIPVTGASYYANFWNRDEHSAILDDAQLVLQRLHALGGTTFGITVGDAGRRKTEAELDAQAELLRQILPLCRSYAIQPNLHNHTFELAHDQHDLLGTLQRVPDLPLGPDVSWLHRAGIDPVAFLEKHLDRIVYLHLRDNHADGRFAQAVGDGVIDFPAIAQLLNASRFAGPVAIELAYDGPATRPTEENWRLSRQRLRQTFGW